MIYKIMYVNNVTIYASPYYAQLYIAYDSNGKWVEEVSDLFVKKPTNQKCHTTIKETYVEAESAALAIIEFRRLNT